MLKTEFKSNNINKMLGYMQHFEYKVNKNLRLKKPNNLVRLDLTLSIKKFQHSGFMQHFESKDNKKTDETTKQS
jgi:hypothetical protein